MRPCKTLKARVVTRNVVTRVLSSTTEIHNLFECMFFAIAQTILDKPVTTCNTFGF